MGCQIFAAVMHENRFRLGSASGPAGGAYSLARLFEEGGEEYKRDNEVTETYREKEDGQEGEGRDEACPK